MVEFRVPGELSEKLENPLLLPAADKFPQGLVDGLPLRGMSADLKSLIEQAVIDGKIGRHVKNSTQYPTHYQAVFQQILEELF